MFPPKKIDLEREPSGFSQWLPKSEMGFMLRQQKHSRPEVETSGRLLSDGCSLSDLRVPIRRTRKGLHVRTEAVLLTDGALNDGECVG